MRPTFRALCNITHQRITVSLAASVHELAKIIGPTWASQDLLMPFFEWLNGNDEIRGRALAQLPTFLGHLRPNDAADTLHSVLAMWETGDFRNWRHREALASHAPAILKVLMPMSHGDLALDLLRSGLFDTFQAIREAAIKAVRGPSSRAQSILANDFKSRYPNAFQLPRAEISCMSASSP